MQIAVYTWYSNRIANLVCTITGIENDDLLRHGAGWLAKAPLCFHCLNREDVRLLYIDKSKFLV